jgi:hypothetical protein
VAAAGSGLLTGAFLGFELIEKIHTCVRLVMRVKDGIKLHVGQ